MKNLFKTSVFLLISLLIGCSSDDNPSPEVTVDPVVTVNLIAAKLDDFKLSEVIYRDVEMRQPEIVEGKEKTPGQIIITIPATSDNLSLSLASVNFDESKFKISPAVGSVQSFEVGSVITYTITSKENPKRSIRYLVSVIKENVTSEVGVKITGFRFEQSKNPSLPSNIEATKIVEYISPNWNVIFVMVPVGTDLTNLTPSIDFVGDSLKYSQGSGGFTAYPTTDLKVNFTSDYDFINFKDKNEFVLSVSSSSGLQKNYHVIVDVENPIGLRQNSVSTVDVVKGGTRRFVFRFVNKGNHPIQNRLDAIKYVDNTPDKKGNIFSSYLKKIVTPTDTRYLIMPGEEGNVSITVDAVNQVEIGNYDVNIVFSPHYDVNQAIINDAPLNLGNPIEDIFLPVTLNVKTKIISI